MYIHMYVCVYVFTVGWDRVCGIMSRKVDEDHLGYWSLGKRKAWEIRNGFLTGKGVRF